MVRRGLAGVVRRGARCGPARYGKAGEAGLAKKALGSAPGAFFIGHLTTSACPSEQLLIIIRVFVAGIEYLDIAFREFHASPLQGMLDGVEIGRPLNFLCSTRVPMRDFTARNGVPASLSR
jgi:hypothetical protein